MCLFQKGLLTMPLHTQYITLRCLNTQLTILDHCWFASKKWCSNVVDKPQCVSNTPHHPHETTGVMGRIVMPKHEGNLAFMSRITQCASQTELDNPNKNLLRGSDMHQPFIPPPPLKNKWLPNPEGEWFTPSWWRWWWWKWSQWVADGGWWVMNGCG